MLKLCADCFGTGFSGWGTALQAGRSRVRFLMWLLEFSFTESFHPHCGPGVDTSSSRNKYQGSSLWGKGGRCVGLTTLPPSCADCLEILGASISCTPTVLSRPVQGQLYLHQIFASGISSISGVPAFLFVLWDKKLHQEEMTLALKCERLFDTKFKSKFYIVCCMLYLLEMHTYLYVT